MSKPKFKYLTYFPKALSGICNSFTVNESKHGEGIKLDSVDDEVGKAIGHCLSHFEDAHNTEDGCLHLESAASRLLKALESYHKNQTYDNRSFSISGLAKQAYDDYSLNEHLFRTQTKEHHAADSVQPK